MRLNVRKSERGTCCKENGFGCDYPMETYTLNNDIELCIDCWEKVQNIVKLLQNSNMSSLAVT